MGEIDRDGEWQRAVSVVAVCFGHFLQLPAHQLRGVRWRETSRPKIDHLFPLSPPALPFALSILYCSKRVVSGARNVRPRATQGCAHEVSQSSAYFSASLFLSAPVVSLHSSTSPF